MSHRDSFRLRFLATILIAVLSCNLLTIPLTKAASFTDIDEHSEFFAAVEYLKTKGVISGYIDGTFKPKQTINRAEALAVVLRAMGIMKKNVPPSPSPSDLTKVIFSDVKATDWFQPFVNQAYAMKLVQGYADKTFRPQNNTNVAESLKIVLKAADVVLSSSPLAADPYSDVGKSLWHAPYVEYTKDKQLLAPQADGTFHAERDITRGDFALLIYHLLYIQDQHLDRFPLNKDWPHFVHSSDHFEIQYPFNWQKIEADGQIVLWKKDEANRQISFARIYPNSATITAVLDQNQEGLTLEDYLAKIHYENSIAPKLSSLNTYRLATVEAQNGLRDFYIQFPNKTVLILYTQTGEGLLKSYLTDEIQAVVESATYHPEASTDQKELFLSTIRKSILDEGKGKVALDSFQDLKLIETDTIGLGTGPVDYYYSQNYDVTLKYERKSQTLLGLKTGKTTAF